MCSYYGLVMNENMDGGSGLVTRSSLLLIRKVHKADARWPFHMW